MCENCCQNRDSKNDKNGRNQDFYNILIFFMNIFKRDKTFSLKVVELLDSQEKQYPQSGREICQVLKITNIYKQ